MEDPQTINLAVVALTAELLASRSAWDALFRTIDNNPDGESSSDLWNELAVELKAEQDAKERVKPKLAVVRAFST